MIRSIQDVLLLLDLDGTLLTDDKQLLSCNLEPLRLFKQMGGRISIATGRVFHGVMRYPELIELLDPSIVSCGGVIYDFQNQKPIRQTNLPRLEAQRILHEYMDRFPRLGCMIGGNNARTYQVRGNQSLQLLFDDERLPYFVAPTEELPPDWNKILFASQVEDMEKVHTYAASRQYMGVTFVESHERYFEVLPEGISKGSALPELCNILGVPLENTIFIGDYYNDLEIMKMAGRSIAMANAPQEVKDVADETTLHCNDGGVGHAVYKLIREYGG